MTHRRQSGSALAGRNGRPRLTDVAAAAGVSTMTVARVLREPDKVSVSTRERGAARAGRDRLHARPDRPRTRIESLRARRRGHPAPYQFADRGDHAGPDRHAGARRLSPPARGERLFRDRGGGAGSRVPFAPRRRNLPHRGRSHRGDDPHARACGHPGRRRRQPHPETDRHGGRIFECRGGAHGDAVPPPARCRRGRIHRRLSAG